MFVDLDWPLNASSLLSASAELLVYVCNIVGLEARLEDAFVKWCDCCFYQLCRLLNWLAVWFPHFCLYRCTVKNGTHCNVGKLTFCAVSFAWIKCGCVANGFKFDVVIVHTLLSGKWKPSINIWNSYFASTQSNVVTYHWSGVVSTFHECLHTKLLKFNI